MTKLTILQTLLAAMARAFALTRPASCLPTTEASERYHITPDELDAVEPLPEGKKKKVKEEVDGARQRVEAKLVEATALLRKV